MEALIKQSSSRFEPAILDEHTIERAYGWVFFFQSKRFLETGDMTYALGGNGPVVVERNGVVSMLGTHLPSTEILAAFEAERGLKP